MYDFIAFNCPGWGTPDNSHIEQFKLYSGQQYYSMFEGDATARRSIQDGFDRLNEEGVFVIGLNSMGDIPSVIGHAKELRSKNITMRSLGKIEFPLMLYNHQWKDKRDDLIEQFFHWRENGKSFFRVKDNEIFWTYEVIALVNTKKIGDDMSKITVIGGGILGLWTAVEAVNRGHHVTLYEKHTFGHTGGSSHGDTRIFRSAYWEGSNYVKLSRRSMDKWNWLGKIHNQTLLDMTGTYYSGDCNCAIIKGVLSASVEHNIPISEINSQSLFRTNIKSTSLLEEYGGIIKADESIRSLTSFCINNGVNIREETEFLEQSDQESIYIKCIGPWFSSEPLLSQYITSSRVYVHWFEHDNSTPLFEKSFLLQGTDGRILYGMRTNKNEIKVGWHNYPIIPLEPGLSEDNSPEIYIRDIQDALSSLTGARLRHLKSKGCYFDNSSDENYIIDWSKPNELIAGGLSGHGFKFAPALADGLITAAETKKLPPELLSFRLDRLRSGQAFARTKLHHQTLKFGMKWSI